MPPKGSGQNAGVNERGVAVGEQGLERFCVESRQRVKRSAPLFVACALVGEEVFGLDPAMTPDQLVRDVAFVKQRDQVGAGHIEDVRRLLRGEHLTDGNERDRIAGADMPEHLDEEL